MTVTAKPRFRCSELDRVLTCPVSKMLAARLPDRDSGAAAWEGNWCHWAAARHLVDHDGAEIGDGGLEKPECGDFTPTSFSQWVVDYFLDELSHALPGMGVVVEDELGGEFDRFILTGHADVLAFSADGTEAIGYDLKAGAIPVDAAEANTQMLGYIALVYLCYPSVRKITWRICQPKNRPDEGHDRVSEVIVGGPDLDAAIDYLREQIGLVLDNPYAIDSDTNQGVQCKYCPAAARRCPAILTDIETMKGKLTPEQVEAIGPDLSYDDLATYEDARKKLSKPLDDAHKALVEKIKTEGAETVALSDGRVLSHSQRPGRRTCVDPEGAYAKLREQQFEPATEAQCVSIKLGDVTDAVAKTRGIPKTSKKKENAKDIVDAEFGPHFEQSATDIITIS